MGNSGSVHHMQPSLKELHSYYQVQTSPDNIEDLAFLNDEQKSQLCKEYNYVEREKRLPQSKILRTLSSTRNPGNPKATADASTKCPQVKVLPNLAQHLRLRSTTNGAILHSGGTISGRKESLIPQPMVRSKTFIHETTVEGARGDKEMSPIIMRRSQTQLSIDVKRNSISNVVTRVPLQENCVRYTRSATALATEHSASVSNLSEANQKLSKVKLKNKKRKAPVPPTVTPLAISQKDFEQRQRMFKTKSEAVSHQLNGGSFTRPQKHTSKSNNQQKPLGKFTPHLTSTERSKDPLLQTNSHETTGFRREKSFDASVLSWRYQNANHQAEGDSTNSKGKHDFKVELEAATKCRLISSVAHTSELRTMSKEAAVRQRSPSTTQPQLKSPKKTMRQETQSKIPQLKKTFYFGMEDIKRKQGHSSQKTSRAPAVKTAHGDRDESEMDRGLSETTVYKVGQKYSSEINDNGIQVNVRPMLPRRQLEIPRFSPIAAWRTLTEEYQKQSLEAAESPHSTSSVLGAANTMMMEDRIYRIYREPCPFYPDNKSGDSGISGDEAYPPEKPIQPRNRIHIRTEYDQLLAIGKFDELPIEESSHPLKVVGPFLAPWTPQQDLDEEDTSSDGEVVTKAVESHSPTSAHVFSLSLPRDNQISLYGEKSKPEFRSLQKLKRFTEFNSSVCECTQSSDSNVCNNSCLGNYRSDNWLLSKTGSATITTDKTPNYNQMDHKNLDRFMDGSGLIQPVSIGCLATGKHLMYLPNRPISELKRQSVVVPQPSGKNCESSSSPSDARGKNVRTRNKRFSFQSSVRQIERRRLAEKLSKDAEQKEALRKSELEAMRSVEEEFQKKRAYEKASICHQLRLYSMEDENLSSLLYPSHACRAEPDGAVSSTPDSPDTGHSNNEHHRRVSSDIALILTKS